MLQLCLLKSLIILASGGHPPSTATIVCLSVNNFFCGLGTICKWTANSLKYALIWGTHFVWSVLYAKKTRIQWLLSTTVGTVLSFKKFRPFWYVRNDIEGHFILQKSISIKERSRWFFLLTNTQLRRELVFELVFHLFFCCYGDMDREV